jgi:hypothetical protein
MDVPVSALAAVCALIESGWGDGYSIGDVSCAFFNAALVEVVASDGARFWVGATRHGNTVISDLEIEAAWKLRAVLDAEVERLGLLDEPRED